MERARETGDTLIAISSHGVRLDVRLDDPALTSTITPLLPPGWREAPDGEPDAELSLIRQGDARFMVFYGSESISAALDLDVALSFLEERIRGMIAAKADDRVFLHAGVVASGERALILPGDSFTGKSVLVGELVRAGATYYSDEFAVLGPDGLVHPYHGVGEAPVPAALVALTRYRPGAAWDPRPVPPGEAALALMSYVIPARKRPEATMRASRQLAESCRCVGGDRGEAGPVAGSLMTMLAQGIGEPA